MKIEVGSERKLVLKEVFSGILLETEEGNQVGLCMRDDTIELSVCPKGNNYTSWWRVNMKTGDIESL